MGWLSTEIDGDWRREDDEDRVRETYGNNEIKAWHKGQEVERRDGIHYSLWVVVATKNKEVSLQEIEISRDKKECAWRSRSINKDNMHEVPDKAKRLLKHYIEEVQKQYELEI